MILTRLFFANIFVILMQYTGLMISSINTLMPIAFATGSACAFIFLRGYSILPGIWLGTAAAFWFDRLPPHAILLHASVLTLQAAIIFWFSCRYIIPTLLFYKKEPLLKFVILILLVTAASNAIINPNPMGINFWLADLNGILTLGCMLIVWDAFFPQLSELKHVKLIPLILCTSILILSIGGMLLATNPIIQLAWLTLNLTSCIIISYQYKWCGSVCIQTLNAFTICFASIFFMLPHEYFTVLQIYLFLNCLLCYSL